MNIFGEINNILLICWFEITTLLRMFISFVNFLSFVIAVKMSHTRTTTHKSHKKCVVFDIFLVLKSSEMDKSKQT